MFIPNPGGGVQALDATNGDLLWEYRRRYERADRAVEPMRSIAIYRRQDHRRHHRRPSRRAQREERSGRLGPPRRRQHARLPVHERPDRREGQGRRRDDGLRAVQERHLLHLRARSADGQRAVAHLDRRQTRRAGRRQLGRSALAIPRGRRCLDPRQLRSRHEPDLLVHGAGEALGARGARHRRRRALHQQHARARPRYGAQDAGTISTCRAKPTTSTRCSRAS